MQNLLDGKSHFVTQLHSDIYESVFLKKNLDNIVKDLVKGKLISSKCPVKTYAYCFMAWRSAKEGDSCPLIRG